MKTSIVFFGTHDFGASMLRALISNPAFEITAAITQPDRPVGRKHEIQKSPVKLLAEEHGIPIYQPESLKNLKSEILNLKFDLAVVCQYGLIIPQNILDLPKSGSINVHPSLLPKYRGASPIQSAIVNGEKETGITIMLMDEKLDYGPILSQQIVNINPDETSGQLRKKIEPFAQEQLLQTLGDWLAKKISPQPQNDSEATFCKMFTRDDGRINWQKTALEIYNLYRGLTPWPGVWTTLNGKRLKLLSLVPNSVNLKPGLVQIADGKLLIGTSLGSIKIGQIQLEGKAAVDAKSFAAGHQNIHGSNLD